MALCTWYSAPEISHCMKIYVQTTYTILQPCPIAKACQQATNCRHTNMWRPISSMELYAPSIQFGKQNRHPKLRAVCRDSQAMYVFSVAKLQGGFLVSWNLQAATICLCLWSGSITTRRLLPPPVWGQLLPPHQLLQARTTSGLAGPLPLLLPAPPPSPPPPPPPPSRCRSCAPTQ